MLPSEKKSSRRRRKTLGKEDSGAEAETESRSEASDGTRSSISGFRLITASSRTVTGLLSRVGPMRPVCRGPIWPAADFLFAQTPASGARVIVRELMLAPRVKEDQGNFGSPGAGVTEHLRGSDAGGNSSPLSKISVNIIRSVICNDDDAQSRGSDAGGGVVFTGPRTRMVEGMAVPLFTSRSAPWARGAARLLFLRLRGFLNKRRRLANGGATAIEFRSDL